MIKNIYWIEKTKKWLVQVQYKKRVYYLGTYEIFNDAFQALLKFKKTHKKEK